MVKSVISGQVDCADAKRQHPDEAVNKQQNIKEFEDLVELRLLVTNLCSDSKCGQKVDTGEAEI